MVEDFDESVRISDEMTRATIADNANMSELLKRKKRMQEAGKGLKALCDSGLTREEAHALLDEAFNAKG